MTAVTLGLLAALAGVSVASASPATRGWLVGGMAAAIAVGTGVLPDRVDAAGTNPEAVRVWRRIELVAIPGGVLILQVLTGSVHAVEFAVAAAVGFTVWALVNATLTDVDAIDRAIELTDGMTPVQRLRIRMMAVGLVSVWCAAVGAVGVDGLVDLARGAAPTWSLAPFAYFVVGLVAVGLAARRAEQHRWRRDGVDVDAVVAGRWARSVFVTVGAIGVVAFLIGLVPTGVTTVAVRALGLTGPFGDWVAARAVGIRNALDTPSAPSDSPEVVQPPVPDLASPEPAPQWVGDVALWALLALVFGFVVMAARNRRAGVSGGEPANRLGVRGVVRLIWLVLVDLVASAWKVIRRILGRRARAGEVPDTAGGGGTPAALRVWDPPDPIRRRIAAAYRRAIGVVSTTHDPPRGPETPREFSARVADRRLGRVTEVFEEARYSDHTLTDSDATAAETAAAQFLSE
ncbi:MAG TPA: DUF4129 domain-containing protein [Acidimicrobiia bacterium]|nr:DUF4129 domain-containing protein [Acidimicrobiia bacterium]